MGYWGGWHRESAQDEARPGPGVGAAVSRLDHRRRIGPGVAHSCGTRTAELQREATRERRGWGDEERE